MRPARIILSLLALLSVAAIDPDPPAPPAAATMPVEPTLFRQGEGPEPRLEANVAHLLSGGPGEANGLALPAGEGVPTWFEAHASVRLDPGGEGFGILLCDAGDGSPDRDSPGLRFWEEPNRPGSIGIGFDGRNLPSVPNGPRPLPGDAADAEGNLYDRPQREVSLHFDGRERANRQAPDFATGQPVAIDARVEFVPGGARVSVSIAGQAVYKDELLAGVAAFAPRLFLGARAGNAPRGVKLDVRDVRLKLGPALAEPFAPPRRLVLFDKRLVSLGTSREPMTTVKLGEGDAAVARGAARVIATLSLAAPPAPAGMDRLDRRGALYCYTPDGQRYEVLRFRTAGAKPWTWTADVTDFLPLFRGDEAKFGLFIDTWQSGYLASVTLDFYPGHASALPVSIVNLWQGEPIIGDASQPLWTFFRPRTVPVPPGATGAKVRLSVTGHGQSPNTENAAEFRKSDRTLWVNDYPITNTLWKTDNYLNPCRPQAGPWRADRAGWGPGSITEPWMVDVTNLWGAPDVARTLRLAYWLNDGPDGPYVNHHVGRGAPPTYWVDGQVVFYAEQ